VRSEKRNEDNMVRKDPLLQNMQAGTAIIAPEITFIKKSIITRGLTDVLTKHVENLWLTV